MMDASTAPLRPFAGLLLLLLLGIAAGTASGADPEFLYLGDLPGGQVRSFAYGVSADGTYVVGESSSEIQTSGQAFIWDPASGMSNIGGAAAGYAVDVSADGQYAV